MHYIYQDRATRKFVAVDEASGGYPYLVDDPFSAQRWSSIERAERYSNTLEKANWELMSLTPRLGPIDLVSLDGPPSPITPPGYQVRHAGHHWLEEYDSDGHFHGLKVLQWNPGAMKWSHSGLVGTGLYVEVTTHWKYHSECALPK